MTALHISIGLLVGVLGLVTGVLFALRQRSYRGLLKFNPSADHTAAFAGSGVETVEIVCDREGFTLPALPAGVAGGFLELKVKAALAGKFLDPVLTFVANGFCDRQAIERGAVGVRFFNVSRLLKVGLPAGQKVALRGERLRWQPGSARLHLCHEQLKSEDRILVIAPHPDDAEIAAFGLYADTGAAVVAITAGDGSDHYDSEASIRLPRATVAKMRVWDSLTVPQLGGVGPEQSLNLCYPDGRLREMHAEPQRDYRGTGADALDFAGLRQLNRSPLMRDGAACSWSSLVRDLAHILATLKPTVVAVPHPWLDPHADHQFTTRAVSEAIKLAGLADGRFYFYVNHNRRSELWPFGAAGSGVAMLPLFPEDSVVGDSFYSHALSEQRQREKFLGLEAMHDLRNLGAPGPRPARVLLHEAKAALGAAWHGTGDTPTSYLRRAVRPDEIFFVASFQRGLELCERVFRKD